MNVTAMSVEDFVALLPGGARKAGRGWTARCPAHEDGSPSLSISEGKAGAPVWKCFADCPQETVLAAMGLVWADVLGGSDDPRPSASGPATRPRPQPKPASPPPRCTLDDVRQVWAAARTRAQDDDRVDDDAAVYEFLRRRGLSEAWTEGALGVVGDGMNLPSWYGKRSWIETGHRLVVPAYDSQGAVASLQGRRVWDADDDVPKTLNPADRPTAGLLFATTSGVQVLRGEWTGPRRMVWGEGMTDLLAASFTSPLPTVSSPGVGGVSRGVGPWVQGFLVLLALDADRVGNEAARKLAHTITDHGGRCVLLRWPKGVKDWCAALTQRGTDGLREFLGTAIREVRG